MIDRRSFMGTVGGLGMLASAGAAVPADEKRRVFVLEQYFLKNGSQVQHIHDHLGKAALKKLVQKKSQNLTCEACGLYKNCKSPKLELRGEGKKKIFILGEFPSETDDKENFIFTDLGNRLLITQLKDLGIDFRKDCWAMNAVNCYLPEYKFPTDKQNA